MTVVTKVLRGEYRDSLALMRISADVSSRPGVVRVVVVMGTPSNLQILDQLGLQTPEARSAESNDLIIALEVVDESRAEDVICQVVHILHQPSPQRTETTFTTLPEAVKAHPEANLVSISVPGEHAAAVARDAINLGLNVFCFSSNVSIEDEMVLKRSAIEKRLLMMGPDCGTAYIDGLGLGFANVVRRGSIGVVSASGSGLQEFSVLVDRAGGGLSHGIGVGGRDLTAEVGGLMTSEAVGRLATDGRTRGLVLLAKKSDPAVAKRVIEHALSFGLPLSVYLADADISPVEAPSGHLRIARSLEEAADHALAEAGFDLRGKGSVETASEERWVQEAARSLAPGQVSIRGLFAGGSLCREAERVLRRTLDEVQSNLAGPLVAHRPQGHLLLDLGAEEFTQGRAHPFIDPRLREMEILDAAGDPAVGILLVDVVLGWGCHPDPAGALAGALMGARDVAEKAGRTLVVVASLCGTDRDPQDRVVQERTLAKSGVRVAESSAHAARIAARVATEAREAQ